MTLTLTLELDLPVRPMDAKGLNNFIYLFICLFIFIYLFIYLFIYFYFYLFIYLFIYSFICFLIAEITTQPMCEIGADTPTVELSALKTVFLPSLASTKRKGCMDSIASQLQLFLVNFQ